MPLCCITYSANMLLPCSMSMHTDELFTSSSRPYQHANVLVLFSLGRCRQGMYELLERGLTPQSARRTGDALALICMELVSGRRQGGLLPPGLASMQPGMLNNRSNLMNTVNPALDMAFWLVVWLSVQCQCLAGQSMMAGRHVLLLHRFLAQIPST